MFRNISGVGSSFGEMALISEDSIRTASIVADVPTDLALIDRITYDRSLKAVMAQEYAEKANFILHLDYIGRWPSKCRKQLAMSLKKITLSYDSTLVKQGSCADKIFYIIRHDFHLTHVNLLI